MGIGTFRPISTERIDEHRMHSERYWGWGGRCRHQRRVVWAVGSSRWDDLGEVLESVAPADGSIAAAESETDLFIRPGYQFRAIDALLTNFTRRGHRCS